MQLKKCDTRCVEISQKFAANLPYNRQKTGTLFIADGNTKLPRTGAEALRGGRPCSCAWTSARSNVARSCKEFQNLISVLRNYNFAK